MKKILVLSSSPRKGGNTDVLCDAFMDGAREAGHQAEKIRLADLQIGYCRACYACKKLGKCVIQDDAKGVLDQMMAADVIVLATPVYFYSCSAQMKALFDRSVAIFPRLTNKEYYYIMAQADSDQAMFAGTIKSLDGFLDCYEGSTVKGMVCAPGVYEKGEINGTPYMEEARELGRQVK